MAASDGSQADSSWWAGFAVAALNPIQMRIIEALRSTDRPQSPAELFQAMGEELPWLAFGSHMRRLADLRVIELAAIPPDRNPLGVSYRLASFQK
jgi:hypothetical protein